MYNYNWAMKSVIEAGLMSCDKEKCTCCAAISRALITKRHKFHRKKLYREKGGKSRSTAIPSKSQLNSPHLELLSYKSLKCFNKLSSSDNLLAVWLEAESSRSGFLFYSHIRLIDYK